MRAIMAAGLFGVIAMTTAVAEAQDKKGEKEPISIRRWIPAEKKFINPVEQEAIREDRKTGQGWKYTGGLDVQAGSEIIDKDGTVWVVTGIVGDWYKCKPTPPAKKVD